MAVVSGIAVAGIVAFTTSSTNVTGTAFANPIPLGIVSVQAGSPEGTATETPSVADLAAERTKQLRLDEDSISESQEDLAQVARSSALADGVETITEEVDRLKNLAKFLWPTAGSVSSPYGQRLHPILHYYRMHDGDDIGGECGQPIYAAQSGTVVRAAMGYNGGSGNNVRIDHGEINGVNVQTGYLHMTDYSVKVGQKVDKGDKIGRVGNTGLSTACHLHFSAYKNGHGTDPMEFIGWNAESKKTEDGHKDG